MRAGTTTLTNLFQKDVQYRVPVFQRPYVWTLEKQWQPLLEDLLGLADTAVEQGDASTTLVPHFMGAVVLEGLETQSNAFEARSVIDGQQRLTTLQLLIGAAQAVTRNHGLHEVARPLAKLAFNDQDLVTEPHQTFKVLPTNANRAAYSAVMGRDGPDLDAPDDPGNQIQEAFEFFLTGFENWLLDQGTDEETLRARGVALRDVIRQGIKLVAIDLESEDDPQAIFETLNDRGTPLLKIELVKNFVFQRATKEGLDLKRLNDEVWARFDEDPYWREPVGVGRYTLIRAELFLMHWLAMKLKTEIKVPALFVRFRELANQDERTLSDLVAEFVSDSDVFRSFDEWQEGTVEHRFFRRLGTLDTTTAFPLVLQIMRQPDELLSSERKRRALRLLESWLVRRAICRLTSKNYNKGFIELSAQVESDIAHADDLLLELLDGDAETTRWPTDGELEEILTSLPIYKRQLTIARTRIVLEAIEEQLRGSLTEVEEAPAGLSIEHVMPVGWRDHWDTDPPMASELANRRDGVIHLLGNLTLITQRLNSSVSNGAWTVKRKGLNEHSVLHLNRPLVEHIGDWDEAAIKERTRRMARMVTAAWPAAGDAGWV